MEPEWSLWVHDIAGNPIQSVNRSEGSDAPFSSSIEGNGESSILISVDDADEPWEPEQIADVFAPNKRFLVRWWGTNGGAHPGDVPVTAHKIDGYDYTRDAGTLTVKAVDLINEATWRMINGVLTDKNFTLTITNRTASGAVAQTLYQMQQMGPESVYPIDLPADAPGTFKGSWPFWKGYSIWEILREIRESMGVEVFLRPYATATGGIRFQTRVGGPITIGGVSLKLEAEETPLSGVVYRVDGSQQVTGVLGLGNGTGEAQETRWAGGAPFLIPIRDVKKSFRDMTGDALQGAVTQSYLANRNPTSQWDIGGFTIDADYSPELVLPGRVINVEVHGDPVIPDGVHSLRVVAVSGGNGRQMKPEVQYA